MKVLDFGLAKAFEGDTVGPDMNNSPTLSHAATMQGVILGTAAYMSPEQARGKAVDKRTDLWAFGCVLYELLTGKPAFRGEDTTDILAAVVRAEPDMQALPAATPVKIRDLLRRCLQKDKGLRMQAAGDARIEIQEALAAPRGAGVEHTTTFPGIKLFWGVDVALAMLLIVALGALWRATRPVEKALGPLARWDVDLGPDVSLGSLEGTDTIISPDGSRLVYVSRAKLVTRRLDQTKATELAGSEGAYAPFFSPDGQWVAFFAQGKLKKISVEGGTPIALCDAPSGQGGSWGEDGNIIAALKGTGGLSRIPSGGGAPTPLADLAPGEATYRWPQLLPQGEAVLFTAAVAYFGFDGANIEAMSLKNHQIKTLVRGGTFGRYLPSGHLLFVNRGSLFAVAFDPDALEVRGTPVPLQEQVAYNAPYGSAQLDLSQTGMLLYRGGENEGSGLVILQWLDGADKTRPLLAKPGTYFRPRLSPDGQRLALEIPEGSNRDVWIYELQRDTVRRLTFGAGGFVVGPVWSPDSRYIAFGGPSGILWTRSDGAGKPEPLTQGKFLQAPFSFTPDGKRLSWNEQNPNGDFSLWTVSLESGGAGLRAGKPERFLEDSFDERHPAFSPDGRWLAYTSNESGTYQVYVRAFPDKGGKWQISSDGGAYPVWSHNGRELFFRSAENRIMVVTYSVKGDSIEADKPRVWSDRRLADFGIVGTSTYDLAPDGKHIVAVMPAETPQGQLAQSHVILLENFFDELRRRVPIGK